MAENARLFEERSSAARTLERALRPAALPRIPGWRLATMYEPATAGGVGGDFYDAFAVEGGWMVVVGDVAGHGAGAAALTAMARETLRTASAIAADPVAGLERLNRRLLERGDVSLCTVVVALLGDGGTVRVCTAGHPAPLVVSRGKVEPWRVRGSILGAFGEAEWEPSERAIGPGDHLVLYTDGLFEVSGADGRLGEERLRQAFAGIAEPADAVDRARAMLHEYADGRFGDDMALVVLRREA